MVGPMLDLRGTQRERMGQSMLDRPKVLIVDDSRAMRTTLRLVLSGDFTCDEVDGAPQALERALAEPPDVIVSDVGMEGMDGYAFLRQVRAEPSLRHVFVILLSGYAPQDARAGDDRADAYFVKPVPPAKLIQTIHALLAGRAA